jgi:hypothetical protein
MRKLISAVLLAAAVISTATAKPIDRSASQSWGYQWDQGFSTPRDQVRSYDQCYALAISRGFSITSGGEGGVYRRDKFIHDCEVGTQS